tara:strand:- start:1073 stop:1396 length:324 start_codon:yes stop_codon:yes gene_type:complete
MNPVFLGLISAFIIGFIILLILKWKNFYRDMKNIKLPPWKNNCPDYWLMEGNGKCRNIHRLGRCATEDDGIIDFNKPPFTGKDGDKNKCRIAKTCNIPWTGIDDKCV